MPTVDFAPAARDPRQGPRAAALVEALQRPACYPHPVDRIELVETHLSWVLLTGDYAYKIKKPVNLGFADFSTLARRRHFCDEELRLNRRYAPSLYLDVVEIRDTAAGPALQGEGLVMEYAVRMRQFQQDALAARLLPAGKLTPERIASLAERIAAFHENADRAPGSSRYGAPDVVLRDALENIGQLLAMQLAGEEPARLQALWLWTEHQSGLMADTARRRWTEGCVRESHGDLHLGNLVLLEGELTPFDGIEFEEGYRWIDVASDIAFTVMDLTAHGRSDLGCLFLNAYLERTGDYGSLRMLRFYLAYRALVRAKVALLRQPPERDDFARYLAAAEACVRPSHGAVIAMHGLSGSGKTTVAGALARALGAIRIRSDVERKRLAGQPALARSHSSTGSGLYAADATGATYARLVALAAEICAAGWPVIVDAACLKRWQRELLERAAGEAGVLFAIVSVRTGEAALRDRIRAREAAGRDASEAGLAVLEHQLASQEPLSGSELFSTITLDGSEPAQGPRWDAFVGDIAARAGLPSRSTLDGTQER
jgi:uncharacterized protein